jgi:hypothetical protein
MRSYSIDRMMKYLSNCSLMIEGGGGRMMIRVFSRRVEAFGISDTV